MNKVLNAVIGSVTNTPLENRIFNAVLLLSFVSLAIFIPFTYAIGLPELSVLFTIILFIQGYIYYLSRVKKRLHTSVILYAVISYLFLIANFYYNSGIEGPTLFIFIFTFQLLLLITPQKTNWIWLSLHIILVTAMLVFQYNISETISYSYPSLLNRYIDIDATYIVLLVLIYFITRFIHNGYKSERNKVKDQNIIIIAQNEELHFLNEEKSRLFSIISHDLRSPLNSIQGYLEMLTEHSLDEQSKTEIEKQLLKLTKGTSEMLFNLLSWSKNQLEGERINLTQINLAQTLQGTIEIQKMIADEKKITFHDQIPDSLDARGDADMMQLAVRNLLSNAIKFTDHNGVIAMKAWQEKNQTILLIKDNGKGMTSEQKELVFSSKIKPTDGTKQEMGVGLGLLLYKDFMELQHGGIWFNSEVNQGSEFYVSLPAETIV